MIIDNLLTKSHFSLVQSVITDESFMWKHIFSTSGASWEESDHWSHSFAHVIFQHINFANQNSECATMGVYQIVLIPLLIALDKQELELDILYRIRAGMLTKTPHRVVHGKHVDQKKPELPNLQTGLYYINDSDGPTYIYDNDDNVIEKVDPIANRWFSMSNDTFHASSTPVVNQVRYVINYNYSIK